MLAQATDMDLAIAELNSAESFLEFFNVSYQPAYLRPRRIRFMRLFRQELEKNHPPLDWNDYYQAVFRAYCLLERDVAIALSGGACGGCAGCQSDDDSQSEQGLQGRNCRHD
ncbi:hypothetical protein IC617_14880 [Neiella sp. HB171785]|uniref:Nitrogenase-stabilizing/protective protein NifW n=1 Tax=Neiella litorisoli TaxID=2771431 RepID=A0A8J6QK76_9GAMM|nr:nitrogenase-stabilizing/protective protein NifW [Neiella litorisoli]MBD1390714.1 hypothetical protein [Neiella litorisoli]